MSFSVVNLFSHYLLPNHLLLNLFLTYSFLSSLSFTVFIKFFLMQKLKSSTILNHKEGKQEETTNISYYWGKNISGEIYPWDYFPGGQFSSGSFVWGAIMKTANHPKDNFPRGQFPGVYCQVAIICGVIVREQ